MKKLILFSVILTVIFLAFGCDQNPATPDIEDTQDGFGSIATAIVDDFGPYDPVAFGTFNEDGYQSQDFNLWAGQNQLAGTVTISNDSTHISVLYDTDESADISAVHVYVYASAGDIPTDGRPTPGRAPYKADNLSVDSYEVLVPFSDFEGTAECGDMFYVVAHAALNGDNPDDNETDNDSDLENAGETAYAGGNEEELPAVGGGGGSWYYAAAFTVICGNPGGGGDGDGGDNEEDPLYTIDGTVFYDLNENGVQDAGEPGIEGVEVTLTVSDGSTLLVSSGFDGSYSFAELPEGDYILTVSEHNDREHTTPASQEIYLSENTSIDFGFTGYTIDGIVFYDLDEDGIQGEGEPGIEGVEITLSDGSSIYSNAEGYYVFEQLAPGNYTVTSGEHNGREHTTDLSVDLIITDNDLTVDFGFEGYHIEGTVFYDVNGNGLQDADDPGLEGISVTLSDGTVLVTDENGYYDFSGLLPGTYTTTVEEIDGFFPTTSTNLELTITDDDVYADFGFALDLEAICGASANGYTIGFWKNNINKAIQGKNRGIQIEASSLESYLINISSFALNPLNFGSLNEAYETLDARGSDEITLLAKQLTGSEFNFMNGAFINGNELVTWAFLYWGEYIIDHEDEYNRNEILEAKDWFDAYNNSHGGQFYGPGC